MKKIWYFVLLLLFVITGCSKNIEWWETYNDWYLSFQYPEWLIISNAEFEDFTYFDWPNINIVRYDYDSYLNKIIKDEWIRAVDLEEWEIEDYEKQNKFKYKNIIDLAKKWDWDWSKICTYDCSWTAWIIWSRRMDIWKTPWILNNYYFTQDDWLACLSQFNTELLLFTEKYVYSIMFKYNFWDVYTFLYPYKTDYGEACMYTQWSSLTHFAEVSKTVEDFFNYKTETLNWTYVESFEKNYNIILKIIDTISL